jgi:hypothetical protein
MIQERLGTPSHWPLHSSYHPASLILQRVTGVNLITSLLQRTLGRLICL